MPAGVSAKSGRKMALLSPFRYPGGKTWLRPVVRQWLRNKVTILAEAFAGGGVTSITALNEGLAKKAIMIERDRKVASVWTGILNGEADWLCRRIKKFKPTRKNVCKALDKPANNTREIIWTTLLRNRVNHGGVIAPGAGLLKKGEAGNGVKSRWYPDTLSERIKGIHLLKERISFRNVNAMAWLRSQQKRKSKTRIAYFIDPPYSLAGKRLYTFGSINHKKLFEIASRLHGRVLITYDDTAEIRKLAHEFGFKYRRVAMRSRHHVTKKELLISKNFKWLKNKQPLRKKNRR
jgi:DNA adenine methylase